MRLTFLTQWFDPEPGAMRGLPLARELVRAGFEVEVVTGYPNYPGGKVYPGYEIHPWQRETVDGVAILRVALYPSHDRSAVRRVANYASFAASSAVLGPLLSRPSDVLYVYHPPPTVGVPAAVFHRLRNVPIVYHVADMWPESALESGMLGRGSVRRLARAALDSYCSWVYSRCQVITVLSPGFKRLLVERGVPAERIQVVYNWADDDVFRPLPRDEVLAKSLGMSGRLNFIYAGNIGPLQALDTVVRAAAEVRDLPDIQVVIAGGGVDEPHLRQLAKDTGAANVLFLGRRPVSEMPAINALADVLLVHLRNVPFLEATIPSKTQVALASGRPVLMAVAGDASDVIRRAAAGIAVPPEDVGAMARAMRDFHAMTRADREQMGARGHDYYTREMSLKIGAERMADIFREVAGCGRRARAQVRGTSTGAVAP